MRPFSKIKKAKIKKFDTDMFLTLFILYGLVDVRLAIEIHWPR